VRDSLQKVKAKSRARWNK